jgi:hypothetical protein
MDSFPDILRLIVSIALLFGCYYFYRAYKKSKRLLPEEVGAISSYTEQAGGHFGDVHWTIPFVRVSCYKNFIAIHCWNRNFVLKAGDVQRIKKEGLISDGIRVIHNRRELPDMLIIWPRNISKLMEGMETSLRLTGNEEEQPKRKILAVR